MLVAFTYVSYFFLTMYSTPSSSLPETYDGRFSNLFCPRLLVWCHGELTGREYIAQTLAPSSRRPHDRLSIPSPARLGVPQIHSGLTAPCCPKRRSRRFMTCRSRWSGGSCTLQMKRTRACCRRMVSASRRSDLQELFRRRNVQYLRNATDDVCALSSRDSRTPAPPILALPFRRAKWTRTRQVCSSGLTYARAQICFLSELHLRRHQGGARRLVRGVTLARSMMHATGGRTEYRQHSLGLQVSIAHCCIKPG